MVDLKSILYLQPLRAISSVGSEHLVYTEGVGGSNPSLPTTKSLQIARIFFWSNVDETRAKKNASASAEALNLIPTPKYYCKSQEFGKYITNIGIFER